MHRVVVNMQNFLLGEAIEQALTKNGDFHVTVVEKRSLTVFQASIDLSTEEKQIICQTLCQSQKCCMAKSHKAGRKSV